MKTIFLTLILLFSVSCAHKKHHDHHQCEGKQCQLKDHHKCHESKCGDKKDKKCEGAQCPLKDKSHCHHKTLKNDHKNCDCSQKKEPQKG